jgi:hypothetical protein
MKRKGPNKAQQHAAAVRAAQTHEDVFARDQPEFGEGELVEEAAADAVAEPRKRSGVRTSSSRRVATSRPVVTVRKLTREQEYSFIKADLRRLLVTAGSLAAVMIVLLFVIEM